MMFIQKAVIARAKMCETDLDRVTSLCEHHSHIIKSCLVMIIGHSNCEKGYKVYNISDKELV